MLVQGNRTGWLQKFTVNCWQDSENGRSFPVTIMWPSKMTGQPWWQKLPDIVVGTSSRTNDGGKLVNGLQKLTNHEWDRLNTLYFFLGMKIFFSKISHFILLFVQNEPFYDWSFMSHKLWLIIIYERSVERDLDILFLDIIKFNLLFQFLIFGVIVTFFNSLLDLKNRINNCST